MRYKERQDAIVIKQRFIIMRTEYSIGWIIHKFSNTEANRLRFRHMTLESALLLRVPSSPFFPVLKKLTHALVI